MIKIVKYEDYMSRTIDFIVCIKIRFVIFCESGRGVLILCFEVHRPKKRFTSDRKNKKKKKENLHFLTHFFRIALKNGFSIFFFLLKSEKIFPTRTTKQKIKTAPSLILPNFRYFDFSELGGIIFVVAVDSDHRNMYVGVGTAFCHPASKNIMRKLNHDKVFVFLFFLTLDIHVLIYLTFWSRILPLSELFLVFAFSWLFFCHKQQLKRSVLFCLWLKCISYLHRTSPHLGAHKTPCDPPYLHVVLQFMPTAAPGWAQWLIFPGSPYRINLGRFLGCFCPLP